VRALKGLLWLLFFTFMGAVLTVWMVVLGFFFGIGEEMGFVWLSHMLGHP